MSRPGRSLPEAGIFIPRRVLVFFAAAALLYVALRILVPPAWIVQQLDSPDGRRSARLLRSRYAARESLVVKVKGGLGWRTFYYSPPLTNDYRVDLGERLLWSGDSRRLFLKIEGRPAWGYDFEARRSLAADELQITAGPPALPDTSRAAPGPRTRSVSSAARAGPEARSGP